MEPTREEVMVIHLIHQPKGGPVKTICGQEPALNLAALVETDPNLVTCKKCLKLLDGEPVGRRPKRKSV